MCTVIVLVFSMWAFFSTVQNSHLHETFFYIEGIYIKCAKTFPVLIGSRNLRTKCDLYIFFVLSTKGSYFTCSRFIFSCFYIFLSCFYHNWKLSMYALWFYHQNNCLNHFICLSDFWGNVSLYSLKHIIFVMHKREWRTVVK